MRLAMLAATAPLCLMAEKVVCPVIADTYVYATPWNYGRLEETESFHNFGASPWLTIRGREYFALFQFDVSAARGLKIRRATLRFYRNTNPVPLGTIGISTISGNGPWAEGNQNGGPAAMGASNYFYARRDDQPWAYPGSDLTDVTFGLGGSLYAYVEPRDAGDGWYEAELPVELAGALIAGDQFGLMLTDEKGQTRARHSIGSRHGRFAASLIVEGECCDGTPPGPVRALKTGAEPIPSNVEEARALGRTTLRPGSVILHFGGAGDDAGAGVAARYELRYSREPITESNFDAATLVPRWQLNPLAPKPHPLATRNSLRDEVWAVVEGLTPGETYFFAARAWDSAGNCGPVSLLGRYVAYARDYPKLPPPPSTDSVADFAVTDIASVWAFPDLLKINPRTGELLEQADFPQPRLRNSVWEAGTGAVRLTGARNEFVAFQLAIESGEPVGGIEVRVAEPLFGDCSLPAIFKDTGAIQLYREWFVPDDQDTSPERPWYPEVLLPLEGPLEIPAKDNGVPGQRVQVVFVDIYIPRDAPAGLHRGKLRVTSPGWEREIRIEVQVLPLTLPDKLNFHVDLNAYGGVNSGYDVRRGTPEYRRLVHAYHRLAHLHRANLNILGYSHSGNVEPDYAPPLTGSGAETSVADWTDWDAHFGPLLDGSAFADLPRAGVPVSDLYLSFHENWPGEIRSHYKWNDYPAPKTTEEYQQLIARHALEAGPIEEGFSEEYQARFSAVAVEFARHIREHGWLQTRYQIYFNNKHYYKDPARGGRGTSWWLLDEPNYRDDIRALSFFGYLAKRWLDDYKDVPIIFRTDVSYIDFLRDLLRDQIDLNVTSKRLYSKNRYLMDNRDRFGKEYWNYASSNHPRESNVVLRAWCWRAWTAGADGIVPWNTVAGPQAWERAEPLTVFYTGSKFGRMEPFASLRLKAYRRGQQDIEYLIMLSQKPGWDREAVSRAVLEATALAGEQRSEDELAAGFLVFDRLNNETFENVRLRVAQALMAETGSPPAGRTPRPR
jgi:hypothetical protein